MMSFDRAKQRWMLAYAAVTPVCKIVGSRASVGQIHVARTLRICSLGFFKKLGGVLHRV